MQLRIRTRDLELPAQTRRGVERRLRLAVGRHAARIAVARVTLSTNPDGRDPTAHCRIFVRLRDGTRRVVEDRAENPLAAAARAAWRLEHRLEGQREGRAGRVA